MIRCRDVRREYSEQWLEQGGCCISCHDDELEGYEMVDVELSDGRVGVVCCASYRALEDAGLLAE